MGDVRRRRAACQGRLTLFLAALITALVLSVQAHAGGPDAGEAPYDLKENRRLEPATTAPPMEESIRPEDKRNGDSPGYPRSYIVPKGLCEGSEAVLEIRR